MSIQIFCPLFKKIFFNMYLFFERQRETKFEWGRGREKETQNPKQAAGPELSAQSPTWGSNPQTARYDLSQSRMLNRLSHPGALLLPIINQIVGGFLLFFVFCFALICFAFKLCGFFIFWILAPCRQIFDLQISSPIQ